MPLYKKSNLKTKIRTSQNSFISPVVPNIDLTEYMKDDYKKITMVQKKLLGPSFLDSYSQDSSASFDVSSTKTCSVKSEDHENVDKFDKILSKTLSDFNRSASLFSSQSSQYSDINNTMVIDEGATKVETSSNTEGDQFQIEASDTSSSTLSELLNECVMTNIRLSQEKFIVDDRFKKHKEIKKSELKRVNSTSTESLDELVNKNIRLSQEKLNNGTLLPINGEKKKPRKLTDVLKGDSFDRKPKNVQLGKDANKNLESKDRVKNCHLLQDNIGKDDSKRENKTSKKGSKVDKKLKEKNKSKYLIKKEKSKISKKLERQPSAIKIIKTEALGKTSAKKILKNNSEERKSPRTFTHRNKFLSGDAEENDQVILSHLLDLQELRDVGLYVYCDKCDKVRYLPDCKDPLDLPDKWYCHMNPDPNYNKCSDPDFAIKPETEQLMIYNKFNAGSIVWAKIDGYPWWPAMVDDDPDTEDYFWLDDENSKEPSWYHVVFFDSAAMTRAWIKPENLEPFKINLTNKSFRSKGFARYKKRINFAVRQARQACEISLLERLRKFSFATRFFNQKLYGAKREKKEKTAFKKDVKKLGKNNAKLSQLKVDEILDKAGIISMTSSELPDTIEPQQPGLFPVDNQIMLEIDDLNQFVCPANDFDNMSLC